MLCSSRIKVGNLPAVGRDDTSIADCRLSVSEQKIFRLCRTRATFALRLSPNAARAFWYSFAVESLAEMTRFVDFLMAVDVMMQLTMLVALLSEGSWGALKWQCRSTSVLGFSATILIGVMAVVVAA